MKPSLTIRDPRDRAAHDYRDRLLEDTDVRAWVCCQQYQICAGTGCHSPKRELRPSQVRSRKRARIYRRSRERIVWCHACRNQRRELAMQAGCGLHWSDPGVGASQDSDVGAAQRCDAAANDGRRRLAAAGARGRDRAYPGSMSRDGARVFVESLFIRTEQ